MCRSRSWAQGLRHLLGIAGVGSLTLLFASEIAVAQSPPPDTSPKNMVAFFMTAGPLCPTGWTPFVPAQGRLLLGITSLGPNGNNLGVQVGQPLADQTPPSHTHNFSTTVQVTSKSIAALSDFGNNDAAKSGTYYAPTPPPSVGTTAPPDVSLPFIQLVVCQKL